MMLAQAQGQFSSETAISIGLVVIIVGCAWKLATMLADIRGELKKHADSPVEITKMGRSLVSMEGRLEMLEDDVNSLWAVQRADDPSKLMEVMRARVRRKGEPG